MGGLVEVHEVEVDLVPGQLDIGLGVQVEQRLAQRVQPGDPHLRRAEGVHPGDHPDHVVSTSVDVQRQPADAVGVDQHRLPHHLHQQVGQALGDGAGLLGDLAEGLLAVQRSLPVTNQIS